MTALFCLLLSPGCSEGGSVARQSGFRLGSRLDEGGKPVPVNVEELCSGGEADAKALAMPYSDASARLGPHRYASSSTFTWSAGTDSYSLSEDVSIERVGPDFHVKIDNDKGYGMEMIRRAGRLFLRSRYSKFQLVSEPGDYLGAWPERAAETAERYVGLSAGALRLTRRKEAKLDGRSALKCRIEKAAEAKREEGRFGPSDFRDGLVPRFLNGEVFFDRDSGVPVSLRLEGQFSRKDEDGEAVLRLKVESRFILGGREPLIKDPEEHLQSVNIEQIPANRLDFWESGKPEEPQEPPE